VSDLYIRVKLGFYSHRKTARLRALIGDDAFWIPPRLWAYAAERQPDGDFSKYESEELAMLLECPKHATSIRQALLKAGFLDEPGVVHDWSEHNGYHQVYSERAKKAAEARWKKEKNQKKESEEKDIDRETSIATSITQAFSPSSKKKFVPPTREELNAEAEIIGLPAIEVDGFVNHYGANGWKVGSSKAQMVSWKHALAGWKTRWEKNGGGKFPDTHVPFRATQRTNSQNRGGELMERQEGLRANLL